MSSPKSNGNRREFMKTSLLVGLAAPAVGLIAKLIGSTANAQGAKAPAAPKAASSPAAGKAAPAPATGGGKPTDKALVMVAPTEPQATALGYVEDAKKVDTKKWPKRAGAEGEKQYCWNCQFYQVPPGTNAKETKAAPCTIFGGRGVTGPGWCNSWVQSPTVKS